MTSVCPALANKRYYLNSYLSAQYIFVRFYLTNVNVSADKPIVSLTFHPVYIGKAQHQFK